MYGENGGQLRHALGVLLREHRIQQRLGGKGIYTVPETTTEAEREELGKQIRRYRDCVLTWCLQAVGTTNPQVDLAGTTGRSRGPAEELRYRLARTLAASTAGVAPSEELAADQQFATVAAWRDAARAAVLGEHDFTAGVSYGQLSDPQCMTVLLDAADVVRGLVTLDRRYDGVPGWENFKEPGRLGRAAVVCATYAGYDEPDYAVDRFGWRPKPGPIDGPAIPGLAGVMQAEYNLLVHLDEMPAARSLRVVMDSQRVVSHEISGRIGDVDPDLATKWATRAGTYDKLIQETRDLGGILGTGDAAGHGSIAASRAQKLGRKPLSDTKQLDQLDRLFARIDQSVRAAVERGVRERLYFLRVPFPRIDEQKTGPVKGVRHRYVPITSPVQTDLIGIVHSELRPAAVPLRPPSGAAQSRLDFEAALNHRPPPRGPSPDAPSA
jgi:hypothetical protein